MNICSYIYGVIRAEIRTVPSCVPVFLLVVLMLFLGSEIVFAVPGDGSAVIIPSSDVPAGYSGEWTIRYTAADTFISGVVELVIPDGWTPPQDTSDTTGGYISVSSQGSLDDPVTDISGMTVTVHVSALDTNQTVDIVYGDGTVSSSANATAQTATGSGVEFAVSDDPTGDSPVGIDSSPHINVVASSPYRLVVAPRDTTATAGEYVRYSVSVQDEYGNSSPVLSDRTVTLLSSGGDFYPTGDHGTEITSAVIPSGSSGIEIDYRYTVMNLSTGHLLAFMVDDDKSPNLISASTSIYLDHGAVSISQCGISADKSIVVADNSDQVGITVNASDQFGNPVDAVSVLVDATGSGNSFTQPSPTGADGTAAGSMRSDTAEEKKITASLDGTSLGDSLAVTFVPGEADLSHSGISSDKDTVIADGNDQVSITVTVRDQYDNPVSGSTVYLEATGSGNTVVQPDGQTGSDGTANGNVSSTLAQDKYIKAKIDGVYLPDSIQVAFIADAADMDVSEISVDSTTAVADGSDSINIQVTVKDYHGNPVSGAAVELEASGSSNQISQPSGATGSGGIAQGTLKSTTAQTKIIRGLIDGSYMADSVEVVFRSGPVSLDVSDISASRDTVNADGVDSVKVTVTVRDQNSNPVQGATVELALTGAGGEDIITQPQGVTGSDGLAEGTIKSITAGGREIRALVNSNYISRVDSVFFRAGNVDAAQSGLSADRDTVIADGVDQVNIAVVARDSNGNPVSGAPVVLEATDTGGGNSFTQPVGNTDQNGEAAGSLRSTYAENKEIRARVDGSYINETAPVEFVPGALDLSVSSISVNKDTVVSDGVDELSVTVTAHDSQENPIAGAGVEIEVAGSQGGNSITQPSSSTGEAGTAVGYIRSTVAETKIIKAKIEGVYVSDSISVVFRAGELHHFYITHDGSGVAGVAESIMVDVRDLYENRIIRFSDTVTIYTDTEEAGDRIDWFLGEAKGTITGQSGDTLNYLFSPSDQGVVTLPMVDEKAEAISIYVDCEGVSSSSGSVLGVDHSGADSIFVVTGDNQRAVVNREVGQSLVVGVEDSYGNRVDNETVSFSVTQGGGTLDTDLSLPGIQTDRNTDSEGLAYCEYWKLGTASGYHSDRCAAEIGGASSGSVSFTATTDHDQVDSIVLTPASGNITIDSPRIVTATLNDQFGNLVVNENLTIYIKDTPADGTLSQHAANPNPTDSLGPAIRSGSTDSTGTISVVYNSPSAAGIDDVIDANNAVVPAGEVADVIYTTVTSGATRLVVSDLDEGSFKAGESFSFKIQAVDDNGNLDPSNTSTVELIAPPAGSIFFSLTDFGPEVTEADLDGGEVALYGRGSLAGDWDVDINDTGGVLNPALLELSILPSDTVDYYDISTSSAVSANQDINMTVAARDRFGNLCSSASYQMDFRAVLAADSSSADSSLTVKEGNLTGGSYSGSGIRYHKAEQIRIEVSSAANTVKGYSDSITVANAPAYQLVKVEGDTAGVTAGDTVLIRSGVYDVYDNPVDNETVSFTVQEGGGSLSSPQESSGPDGLVSVNLITGNKAGENAVRAVILDGNPEGRETNTFSISTLPSQVIDYALLEVDGFIFPAGDTIILSTGAYDQFGNLIASDSTSNLVPVALQPTIGFVPDTVTLSGGRAEFMAVDSVAGTNRIAIEDPGGQQLSSWSDPITITSAPAYRITSISGDTTGVISGATTEMRVRVRDRYGNPVPGEIVHFTVTSDLGGSTVLSDTAGAAHDGLVLTGSDGSAACSLTTDTNSGENRVQAYIDDGTPQERESIEFTILTAAGSIHYYTVIPDGQEETAGQPIGLEITGYDQNDNRVYGDDTTVVDLDSDGSAVYSRDPVTLSDGAASVTAYETEAGPLVLSAQTQGGGGLSYSDTITVLPDVPRGSITIESVIPDTITADGLSKCSITTNPITDMYGNIVSTNNLITVNPSSGTVTSDDEDPMDGKQRFTAANGKVAVFVQSSTSPGTHAVDFESVEGSASGSYDLVFAASPQCVYGGYLSPRNAVPGQQVRFRCMVVNNSATGLNLDTGSSISFSDSVGNIYQANLSSSRFIGGGAADTLVFQNSLLDENFLGGNYTPRVTISGTDIYSSSYQEEFSVQSNALSLSFISITGIVASQTVLSRGDSADVTVDVQNKGGRDVRLDNLQLSFAQGLYEMPGDWNPPLPDSIRVSETRSYSRPVYVRTSSPVGLDTIDASAVARVNGMEVRDNSADDVIETWLIQSAANISYQQNSLSPDTVSPGQNQSFTLNISNSGDAAVILEDDLSLLQFSDGTETFQVALGSEEALTGHKVTTLSFPAAVVPSSMNKGKYSMELTLYGWENGGIYDQSIILADSVVVVSPAALEYIAGSAEPPVVSKNSTVSFSVGIINNGGATVVCNPSLTRLSFEDGTAEYTACLDQNRNNIIYSGSNTLYFNAQEMPDEMANGAYYPQIHISGLENGIEFSRDLTCSDSITVQEPSQLSVNRIDVLPSDHITADQSRDWMASVVLHNYGGATVRLDSMNILMFAGSDNVTGEYTLSLPDFTAGNDTLRGGETESYPVNLSDRSTNSMTTGTVVIEATLYGVDLNSMNPLVATTESGGKGSFLVQTPADPVILSVIPGVDRVTVSQSRDWTIDYLISNRGESDVEIDLDPVKSYPVFSTSDDFNLVYPDSLAGGGNVLEGETTDTLRYIVDGTGSVSGICEINAEISAVEINSLRTLPTISAGPGFLGEVEIETPADIVINGIFPLQDPVTMQQEREWGIDLSIANMGGSDVELEVENSDSTTVSIPGGAGFHFIPPVELTGGGVVLEAGQSGTLRYSVDTTGFVSPGRRPLEGSVLGTEINSGRSVYADTAGTDSVTFQIPPSVSYTPGSLSPLRASRGSNINVELGLESSDPNMSTVILDAEETYVSFRDAQGDSFYSILSPLSENIIEGGGNTTLIFQGSLAGEEIETGSYTLDIHLEGSENGNPFSAILSASPEQLVLEEASRLIIESIQIPPSVTAELQPWWEAKMVVRNLGEASIYLDLSPSATNITFNIAGEGDRTGEYSIVNPDHLEIAGSDTLAGGMSDTLVFTVQSTGVTTGTALVNGSVTGTDINSMEILTDDTYGSGGSYILIQSAGIPAISGIEPGLEQITSGQVSPWEVNMEVVNNGEADLTLLPDSTYIYGNYSLTIPERPDQFTEGGIILPGGETRNIVFSVTPSPSVQGGDFLYLDSRLGMVENNRQKYLYYDSGEGGTGKDTLRIQAPADLNIVSLINSSIRTPYVNTGQTFPLTLQVANNGEAPADSVTVSLTTEGSSRILDSPLVIERLKGSRSLHDTFLVTASQQVGPESLRAELESALDGNSMEKNLVVISPPLDSVALVEVQEPGDLAVESVRPSQSEVNAGQTVDWWIKVTITNRGEAPVQIEAPDVDDIVFSRAGSDLPDYLIDPPEGLGSGNPGLTLGGMETDSLIYTVMTTGNDTGTVNISANITWMDLNQPSLGPALSPGDSMVYVDRPSGVRIVEIASHAPNNNQIPNTSVVNTGQVFNLTVRVENTGGDDLDSVTVRVSAEGEGQSHARAQTETPRIDSGEQGEFDFIVTAGTSAGNEVLQATIDKAVSINTGEEVDPIQALESVENLVIQNPARLSSDAAITSPPGAADDTLSASQEFILTSVVSNLGESTVDDSGIIKLDLPPGFDLVDPVNQPQTRSFIPEEEVSWAITAPASPVEGSMWVEIENIPLDLNTLQPCALEDSVAELDVVVERAAGISDCDLAVNWPDGSLDGTLSTGQRFGVEAVFTPSANSREVMTALQVPPGFTVLSDSVVVTGRGAAERMEAEWEVRAPGYTSSSDTVKLWSEGVDANSGRQFAGCSPRIDLNVEEKASLDLQGEIAGPPEAKDGEISVNLPFTVSALVSKYGDARVDLEGSRLRLILPRVGGYSFDDPSDSLLSFEPGNPVTWSLVAPSISKPRDRMIVEFAEPLPTDGNSGQPVVLEHSQSEIWVETVAGVVTMKNLSRIDTIPPYVVPRGTGDVPVLRIAFGDSSSYTVGLNYIHLTVLNGSGIPLSNPSSMIDSLTLVTSGGRFSTEVGTDNPVSIDTGYGFQLDSGEGDTVLVEADIASGASPGEIRVDIAGGGDVNFTVGNSSGPGVGVVRDEDGGSISGYFLSGPMNVMSSVFEEYVHNYPNPFRAGSEATRISYFLSSPSRVRIRIYDLTGHLVWTREVEPGRNQVYSSARGVYEVEWDGRNDNGEVVRNGVYICKITAGSKSAIFKIAVAK